MYVEKTGNANSTSTFPPVGTMHFLRGKIEVLALDVFSYISLNFYVFHVTLEIGCTSRAEFKIHSTSNSLLKM